MHKINLSEAQTCLAELVKEAEQGEDVIITQENGSEFQLVRLGNGQDTSVQTEKTEHLPLFNPEGIWAKAQPITDKDIADARKEMWQKFDTRDH